jgi:integrase
VRYRKPDHSQTDKRGFRTKRDAEEFLATVEVSKARGEYIDPALARVTIGDWADRWLEGQVQLKPTTIVGYQHSLTKHIRPRWGHRRLNDVGHAEVQSWIGELSRTLAPQTVRNIFAVFSLIFSFAVRDGRLIRNPADGIRLPRRTRAARGYLTHEQLHRLAAECGVYRTLVLFLGYTGLRWGEAAALRVRDVNLARRRVEVARAVSEPAGRIVFGTPKTHARRSVPFPQFLSERIEAICATKEPDDLLFPSPEGTVIRAGNFRSRTLALAVQRIQQGGSREVAGGDPSFPTVTPHDLRHTAASLALSSGANVKAIQGMLGHASATMTLDVYADLFPDDLDSVAAALDIAAQPHVVPRETAPQERAAATQAPAGSSAH